MSKQVQNFIDDARRFQRCSDHDLAISSLQLAQQEDHHKEHEIEIQKLFSLSYRKIGNYNMALLHINNAINQNAIPLLFHMTAMLSWVLKLQSSLENLWSKCVRTEESWKLIISGMVNLVMEIGYLLSMMFS